MARHLIWFRGENDGSGRTGNICSIQVDPLSSACFFACCSYDACTPCTPSQPSRDSLFLPRQLTIEHEMNGPRGPFGDPYYHRLARARKREKEVPRPLTWLRFGYHPARPHRLRTSRQSPNRFLVRQTKPCIPSTSRQTSARGAASKCGAPARAPR